MPVIRPRARAKSLLDRVVQNWSYITPLILISCLAAIVTSTWSASEMAKAVSGAGGYVRSSVAGGGSGSGSSTEAVASPAEADANSASVKAMRRSLIERCQSAKSEEEIRALGTAIKERSFTLPSNPAPRSRTDVPHCKYVVLDLGANVGDTAGHVMDAGLVGCKRKEFPKDVVQEPHFNLPDRKIDDGKRNPITQRLLEMVKVIGNDVGPEDYCYYGVEGNPVFTDQLQKLEDWVMAIKPRPVRHLHFYTESVGMGKDGPTQLYLDTVNKDQNFWGSSVFDTHQDAKKSAATDGKVVAAPVMGYTVGTLMKNTLAAFDPDAPPEAKAGGHLLAKIDIEGGEYPLIIEAAESGVLCDYVKMGNKADFIVEYHSQRVTGPNSLVHKVKPARAKLEACGVNFRKLQAWWS